ncbi:MAG TPA: ATP-binding cassette domain-containing protein, partial [Candidatus Obscuribacterales bacterium]
MKESTLLLDLTDVTAGYGQTPVLFDVSMTVHRGEIVCLLGRNGVGKTTLLRSIVGLNKVNKGSIIFDADDITKVPTYKRTRYGIAYIPQGREIIPYLSVLDNLKLGLTANRNSKSRNILEEIFEFFPMLKQHLKRQGGLLSGGQQQQLAIARGLMSDP